MFLTCHVYASNRYAFVFSDSASWIDYILATCYTDYYLFIKYYFPLHVSSLKCSPSDGHQELCREWQYHMLHVYNCILLKMST